MNAASQAREHQCASQRGAMKMTTAFSHTITEREGIIKLFGHDFLHPFIAHRIGMCIREEEKDDDREEIDATHELESFDFTMRQHHQRNSVEKRTLRESKRLRANTELHNWMHIVRQRF
jgi:hypothetical protein